jgi:hypothetical protein
MRALPSASPRADDVDAQHAASLCLEPHRDLVQSELTYASIARRDKLRAESYRGFDALRNRVLPYLACFIAMMFFGVTSGRLQNDALQTLSFTVVGLLCVLFRDRLSLSMLLGLARLLVEWRRARIETEDNSAATASLVRIPRDSNSPD